MEICWELAAAYNGDISARDVLDAAPAAFLKLLVEQGAGRRGEAPTPELAKVIAASEKANLIESPD